MLDLKDMKKYSKTNNSNWNKLKKKQIKAEQQKINLDIQLKFEGVIK